MIIIHFKNYTLKNKLNGPTQLSKWTPYLLNKHTCHYVIFSDIPKRKGNSMKNSTSPLLSFNNYQHSNNLIFLKMETSNKIFLQHFKANLSYHVISSEITFDVNIPWQSLVENHLTIITPKPTVIPYFIEFENFLYFISRNSIQFF